MNNLTTAENNNIVLEAIDFQYPTKEELKKINSIQPKFTLFSFPYINELSGFFKDEEKLSLKEIKKGSHLYWWNHSLQNRVGSLTHAYTLALVNFNRGIPDIENCNDQNYINRIQFDFYCETYFYFFVSVQDTIWQILNVYYNIDLEENKVYINNTFLSKIKDDSVKDKVIDFHKVTLHLNNFRNKFTHRFLVTHPDHRLTYTEEDGNQILNAGLGDFIKSSDLADHIKTSLEQIAAFISDLSKLM